MELRHLRTLVAVARHQSFTKAGEELHLAQSAISQQMRRLEDELGVQVLRRSSRSVEVTPEGRLVLAYARRVLAEVEGLHSELEELTGLLRGKVSIGATYPHGPYDFPGVLAEFRARHPAVTIHMLEDTADAMLDMLRRDELDCAFSPVDPDGIGDEFAATLLWQEELVVVARPGHPLLADDHVTWEALTGEDMIAYRDNSALRTRFERTIGQRGIEPRNAFVCTEMGAVRALASRGLGIAVLPRTAAEQPGPPIAVRPIGPEPVTWPIALVWRAGRRQPPAAKAFLKLTLEMAETADGVERLAA